MKFRKLPVVIDAVQWTGDNLGEVFDGLRLQESTLRSIYPGLADETLHIDTREGRMTASLLDWIIRGVQGELYPCKPDIFAATYEPTNQE